MMKSVFLVLFAALCLTTLHTHVEAAPPGFRGGLCVTSNVTAGTCDVVADGQLTNAWKQQVAYNTVTQPTFFVNIAKLDPNQAQDITVTYGLQNGVPIVTTIWALSPIKQGQGISENIALNGDKWMQFNGALLCDTIGWTYGETVTISFPAGSGYNPINIVFAKECVWPALGAGTYNSYNNMPPYDTNVIYNSLPVASFAPFIVTDDIKIKPFYVFLNQVQSSADLVVQPYSLVFGAEQPEYLIVTAASSSGWQGDAFQSVEFPFLVSFECTGQSSGVKDVTVLGDLEFGWTKGIQFSFKYRCGSQGPVPGLNIGSALGLQNMMAGGFLQPPWGTSQVYTPDETFIIQMWMTSNNMPNLPYAASFAVEDSQIFEIVEVGQQSGVLVLGETNPIFDSIVCNREGTAHALIQIQFADYIPAQFEFMYTCLFSFFNVGTMLGGSNVVGMSVPRDPSVWASHIPAGIDSLTLYISLDPSNQIPNNPYTLTANQYRDIGPLTQIVVVDPSNHIASAFSSNKVTINFNCPVCSSTLDNVVTFTLMNGWAVPITFTAFKDCAPTPACSTYGDNNSNGGGWSAAGIFFFVLFWLILVGCIGGCVYNRFKANKHGLAIVPGAETVEGWIDRCRTGNRSAKWTPQDDDAAKSSASYTYQTGSQNYSTNL